jgi:hypothetical protein
MSAAQRIHAWLQGPRTYAQGLELLKAHGTLDAADLYFLELGETSVSREELVDHLKELHRLHVEQAQVMQVRNVAPHTPTKADIAAERKQQARDPRNDGFKEEQLPQALQAVHDQAKRDLREMDYYRHRLESLPSDDDRLRDALIVVELDDRIVSAYARLDAWKATGKDPGEAARAIQPAATRNSVELVKRLKTIESYLSRARSGSRKVSPAKSQLWEKEREELKALIDALPA